MLVRVLDERGTGWPSAIIFRMRIVSILLLLVAVLISIGLIAATIFLFGLGARLMPLLPKEQAPLRAHPV